jgi:hypothetical protein
MRAFTVPAALLVLALAGCSGNVPTTATVTLTPVSASAPVSAVAFGGLTEHEAAVDSYSEGGFTVKTSRQNGLQARPTAIRRPSSRFGRRAAKRLWAGQTSRRLAPRSASARWISIPARRPFPTR